MREAEATDTLTRALADLGVAASVERRETLAILTLADADPLRDPEVRAAVVALAAEHGFTHVALELTDHDDAGASLSRD